MALLMVPGVALKRLAAGPEGFELDVVEGLSMGCADSNEVDLGKT